MTQQDIREQLWFIEQEVRIGNLSETEAADQILSRISPKLTPLSDEEIHEFAVKVKGVYYTGGIGYEDRLVGLGRVITQATVDKIKKELGIK